MKHPLLVVAAAAAVLAGCRARPETALGRAAHSGDMPGLKALLARGAPVDGADQGLTALHWAARGGHAEALTLLLAARSSLDRPDGRHGWTALLHAVHKRREAAVRVLLEAGADPNTLEGAPLLMAAGYGHTRVVRALLDHGADPRAHKDGANALWAAAGGGAIADFTDGPPLGSCSPETVDLLLERAPDLRLPGGAPLHALRAVRGSKTCEALVERLERLPVRVSADRARR